MYARNFTLVAALITIVDPSTSLADDPMSRPRAREIGINIGLLDPRESSRQRQAKPQGHVVADLVLEAGDELFSVLRGHLR